MGSAPTAPILASDRLRRSAAAVQTPPLRSTSMAPQAALIRESFAARRFLVRRAKSKVGSTSPSPLRRYPSLIPRKRWLPTHPLARLRSIDVGFTDSRRDEPFVMV